MNRLEEALARELSALDDAGTRKGAETVVTRVLPAAGERGPRVLLEGEGDRAFLRMNSNGYLGLSLDPEVIAAEEKAAQTFGAGPQAVRFISGTFTPHVSLERRLAGFHDREAGMIFSSAYATVMGVVALNHNCIINATRLARPREKIVYQHLAMDELRAALERAAATCRRALVVTDGVFSMRGDHAPLDEIAALVAMYDERFAENAVVVVDDSHGVGAFGATGRGTEEVAGARADLLIATLGKAFGVNGGYAVGSGTLVDYLRETAPFYVYSNPITPGEAAAAERAIEILSSERGAALLTRLRSATARFRTGLERLGFETLPGEHPVVPLLVGNTERTRALVAHLRGHGILATGLVYPVVPRGEEEIRFQLSAAHTDADVDETLDALAGFSDH
jgi:glycine C-acetyltransferase